MSSTLSLPPSVTESWAKMRAAIVHQWKAFSPREIGLISLMGGSALVIGAFLLYDAIATEFAAQERELLRVEQTLKNLPSRIDTYSRLLSKRDAIEEKYKNVEIKEGTRSYLENLVKSKAQSATPPIISDGPAGSFGKDYEQSSYRVRFSTTSLHGLIETLRELAFGARPLIVGRLKLDMSPRKDTLHVEMEVSSIKPKSA